MIFTNTEKEKEKENSVKIDLSYLEEIKTMSSTHFFGNWINNIDTLKDKFLNASPFEHIVIDDFLETSYAETIFNLFPTDHSNWHKYENPIEVKFAFDNINEIPIEIKNFFYLLSCPNLINAMKDLTNIKDLEYDEYLHGAGLHSHPRYGRLNIHLDYEKHPFSGKERRLNIILFMTKNWNTDWNGANELWDKNVTSCISKTDIKFNRAIIFKTNDISWHGLPNKIMCPEGIFRNSLAYYYVSPINTQKDESNYRKKAQFVKLPDDPYDENMQKLYEIRPHRRILPEDLKLYVPDWTIDK
jgi:hypothetical protein